MPQSPVDPADAASVFTRAAVVLASCIGDDGANRNVSNLWEAELIPQFWGRFHLQAECLATAGGGCDAVTECLGYGVSEAPSCVQGCNGNLFTHCEGEYALRFDCGALGMTCHDGAACIDGEATPCTDREYVTSCTAGGDPLTCNDDFVRTGPNCAALGLRCDQGACRGTGATCQGAFPSSEYQVEFEGVACRGDLLQACVAGSMHERDCASVASGFSCRMREGVAFCGLADECVPGNLPNYDQPGTPVTCDGSILTFCNAGRIETIDCRTLGFDTCDLDTEGCVPNFASELTAAMGQ